MKKVVFLFIFMISFFVLGNKDTLVFAEELEDVIDINIETNLNDLPYTVVSEEKVISDYMEWANVDRETAVRELRLEESDLISINARSSSSCWHQWREYKIPKKLIDSGSKAYLTTYPYIKMKQCGNDRAEITDVSSQVSYVREGGIAISNIVVKNITAEKESKHVARVRANGVITNTLGFELRDWKYSETFTFMGP